jgi:hypothetical protein
MYKVFGSLSTSCQPGQPYKLQGVPVYCQIVLSD